MTQKHVATLTGKGLLQLAANPVRVNYEIHVSQGFDGGVPTLKSARGRVINLSPGDAMSAMTSMKPVTLELADGRKAQVLLIDLNGTIQVTGPIE